jgi:hypothetical protein
MLLRTYMFEFCTTPHTSILTAALQMLGGLSKHSALLVSEGKCQRLLYITSQNIYKRALIFLLKLSYPFSIYMTSQATKDGIISPRWHRLLTTT